MLSITCSILYAKCYIIFTIHYILYTIATSCACTARRLDLRLRSAESECRGVLWYSAACKMAWHGLTSCRIVQSA